MMDRAAAMMVETQFEARTVVADAIVDLRPVPIWCPLPREDDDPKVTCVGWVAGRQTARTEGLLITSTWCRVNLNPPQDLVSRPEGALRVERLPAADGCLWALSRPRSLDWLGRVLASKRRFRTSLDLGAINERRAAAFAGARATVPLRPPPLFGRGWWVEAADPQEHVRLTALGALEDRFVLVACDREIASAHALADDVETIVHQRWREDHQPKVNM
jgi:hypothetical protein